jgi:hypothetical protein
MKRKPPGGPKTAEGRERGNANLRPGWVKGQSGNPKGRAVEVPEIRLAFRLEALECLAELCRLRRHEDGKVAVQACKAILDHGLPKLAPVGPDGKTSTLEELVNVLKGGQ